MAYNKEKLKKFKGKFVVQRHDATNLHYDFRLEFPVIKSNLSEYKNKRDFNKSTEPKPSESLTVLRSWAIPKHALPSTKPLLAKETEDHDINYATFEGEIPEGEYGAGQVNIFDEGSYEIVDMEYDHKYIFKLSGKKTNGLFGLIKTKGKNWLFIKIKNTKKYEKSSALKIAAFLKTN